MNVASSIVFKREMNFRKNIEGGKQLKQICRDDKVDFLI